MHLFIAKDGTKRYFFNTSWLLLEQIVRLLVGVLVGIYVARYLGPEKFGRFNYAIAYVALFAAVARMGLDGVVIREFVREPNHRAEILATATALKALGGLMAVAIVALSLIWTSVDDVSSLYVLIIAAGLVFSASDVVDFYFQATTQAKYSAIVKVIQLTVSSLVKVFLVYRHADLIWLVLVTVLDQVTLALAYIVAAARRNIIGEMFGFSLSRARLLLKSSWPMMLSGVAIMFYMRIDQVMIKRFIGDAAVGQYSAAVRISEIWYFVPTIICTSLFPAILSARHRDRSLYLERLRHLYALMILLGVTAGVLAAICASWVISLLFGHSYAPAAPILRLHIWAGIFVCIGVASEKWFIAEGKLLKYTRNVFFGAILNVILNLWLIPAYGAIGAARATLVSQGVAAYLLLWFDRSTRQSFFLVTRSLGSLRS